MSKRIIYATALLFLLSGLVFGQSLQERARKVGLQPLKNGTEMIDFELEDIDGRVTKLSSFKGKVIFLNFWATWCPPCREEMPSMQELYSRLGDDGLEIVAVDLQEDAGSVKSFFDEHGLTFTALLDKTGRVGATYGARNIPTTYIIDRKGFVIAGTIGGREWNTPEMIGFFETLLAE